MQNKQIITKQIKNVLGGGIPDVLLYLLSSTMPWLNVELLSPVVKDFGLGINMRFNQLVNRMKHKH